MRGVGWAVVPMSAPASCDFRDVFKYVCEGADEWPLLPCFGSARAAQQWWTLQQPSAAAPAGEAASAHGSAAAAAASSAAPSSSTAAAPTVFTIMESTQKVDADAPHECTALFDLNSSDDDES